MPTLSDDDLFDLLGPEPEPAPYVRWAHQAKEYEQHKNDRARVLLWTMRTGKTKSVIDKAEYQYSQDNIEGVIVIAPNGIHLNWTLNEIPKWAWPENGTPCMFAWETEKRADWDKIKNFERMLAYRDGLKWFAINKEALRHPDGIKAIKRFRVACGRKGFMMVISEAHHFGRAGAHQTRLARNLARHAKFVTLETGTAILNSPLRAYSIYKVLQNDALGPEFIDDSYEAFARRYAVWEVDKRKEGRRRQYKKVASFQNLDELRDKIAPWSSVVVRSDIKDMPPLLETVRPVVMSEPQRTAYLEMVSKFIVEIGDKEVSAIEGGARVQKLQQILNGYIKDDKEIIEIDPNAPIYEALVDEVKGTMPGKSIVWCRYREDIRRCVVKLKLAGIMVLEYHGGIPADKREAIRRKFQDDPRWPVLVGHPAAGGEGRDFSAADAIIFFSSTPNAVHYEQGKERGTVVGGKPVTLVRLRTYGTVDDRNWDIVDKKIIMADDISGSGLRDLLMRTDV